MNGRIGFIASVLVLLIVLALAGCATRSDPKPGIMAEGTKQLPPLTPRPDSALVCLYRPQGIEWYAVVPSLEPFRILLNKRPLADLPKWTYHEFYLPPGTNTFGCRAKYPFPLLFDLTSRRNSLMTTNLEAGATYYLQFTIGGMGPELNPVDLAKAQHELQSCKKLDD